MAVETSYSNLRQNLASLMDRVVDDQEVIIVRRRGARDVAMLPAGELASLLETAYLLRSPKNAARLLGALKRVQKGEGKPLSPAQLRREAKLEADSKS